LDISMALVTFDKHSHQLTVHSVFIIYGDAASDSVAQRIASDIDSHWNEPAAKIRMRNDWYAVHFNTNGRYQPDLKPETVWYNDDPSLYFFRVEEYVMGNISFVDGLNSNTGYFKLDNLLQTSTTAAHEFGHCIGLEHPTDLDIRGQGQPGIMYPRGTICDPEFQYDPAAVPLQPGGTLMPHHRKVSQHDVDALRLSRISFNEMGKGNLGGFSSIYHEKHIAPPEEIK